jgi:hypothetical protein
MADPTDPTELLREIRDLLTADAKAREEGREEWRAFATWQQRLSERLRKDAWWRLLFFLVYGVAMFMVAAFIWG